MRLPSDDNGLIDVRALMRLYSIDELNKAADDYYADFEQKRITLKPFDLPGAQHLFAEFAHLLSGLELMTGDRVLDFGCGIGWSSRMLNACGCEVIGMDVSGRATEIAGRLSDEWRKFFATVAEDRPSITFKRFDGYRIGLPDASVDKIVVIDAFHHIPNPDTIIREFHRVLVPGGVAAFCEPGPNHSRSPEAQLEMKLYKVIENDIDVDVIWAQAEAAGFASMDLFITPLIGQRVSLEEYRKFPGEPTQASNFLNATNWRAKNFPIFFLRKDGSGARDSRRTDGLKSKIQITSSALQSHAGAPAEFRLNVMNIGTAKWLASGANRGSVNIGILITSADRTTESRSGIGDGLKPGDQVDLTVQLPVLPPGNYHVEIDIVAEFVCWFRSIGNESVKFQVEIV